MGETIQVRINEAYRGYTPPFNATNVVRKLLAPVHDKYLRGLDCVVLTNETALSRKDRLGKVWSRKRKFEKKLTCGFYHPEWHGNPPWIEIRVDRTVSYYPRTLLWLSLFRELCIGDVLYHELGHHVHFFVRPEHREKEDVADAWRDKFLSSFVRKRYWYGIWPFVLVGKARRLISRKRDSLSPQ